MKSRVVGPILVLQFLVLALLTLAANGCGGGEAAAAALERSLEASSKVTARATYEISFEPGDGLVGYTLVVAQRPPDHRIDVLSDGRGYVSSLDLEGRLFSCDRDRCSEIGGGEGEKPDEYGVSPADDLYLLEITLGFRDYVLEEGLEETVVDTLPDEEILGIDAACFRGTDDERGVTATADFCFSKDNGALLKMSVTWSSESGDLWMSIEATNLNYSVTDEDFALPAPLTP